MEAAKNVIGFLIANYEVLIGGSVAALSGVVAIALVIPGEQPEKALLGVVNFLKKFSKK